ncbi:CRISPR-associated endoribonuclease Cas6 [Actinomadura atramentaria]|uniref:CRISPR-associated endoribonuclease Cas6 n=1 Tax=Actinomadura atramentaria TaxID=1990 RepID=UPI000376FAC0|nr:CRISPR-associated endoribonuclease Cas6 [Actinomadura atramentaria]
MRLRIEVATSAAEIPWPVVLTPGRSLAYDLLSRCAPQLGRRIHEQGWGPHGLVPFGYGAPVFPQAKRAKGKYAAGGKGTVEIGSPLAAVVEAWALGLREREIVDWGGVALRILNVVPVETPSFESGRARFRTATPVVMKGSGRDEWGVRKTRNAWLMPTDDEFPVFFENNLRRKAESIGLDPDVELEAITWVGAKRSFTVKGGAKPGAPVEVAVRAAPETLAAIWCWGLGQANSAGLGWIKGPES